MEQAKIDGDEGHHRSARTKHQGHDLLAHRTTQQDGDHHCAQRTRRIPHRIRRHRRLVFRQTLGNPAHDRQGTGDDRTRSRLHEGCRSISALGKNGDDGRRFVRLVRLLEDQRQQRRRESNALVRENDEPPARFRDDGGHATGQAGGGHDLCRVQGLRWHQASRPQRGGTGWTEDHHHLRLGHARHR